MPELPEVQTVLDTLKYQIRDCKITDINVIYKPIVNCELSEFNKLIGQHFRDFKRRGKYLLFIMDDVVLVSHLRMEGKYYLMVPDEPVSKHMHVIFGLDNGKQLRYNDVRKFGRMELYPLDYDFSHFKNLGPEPFDESFNHEYVKEYFSKIKKPIKEVLLDQSFVAGCGNIYADEVCSAIEIRPDTPVNRLNDEDIDRLIVSVRDILNEAIKAGGTTIRSYTSSLGVSGRFQLSLRVHTLDKCPKCGSDIIKIRIGGRGTYYCPLCQKER